MTMVERSEIFAKDVLTIADFQKLFDMNYNQASEMMVKIRTKLTKGMGKELRLDIKGKIHTQDYLDWVGVSENRYSMIKGEDYEQ